MYYEYREPVRRFPRIESGNAPRRNRVDPLFLIENRSAPRYRLLRSRILRAVGDWTRSSKLAIDDCWKRLLNPSIQGEIRLELKKRSDTRCHPSLPRQPQNLLLAAPAGPISVLGIDPGLRTGCKVAVVDETGKFSPNNVLYLHTSKSARGGAADRLVAAYRKT